MAQKEIKFITKLVNMRKAADRIGANRKEGVMEHVLWLERHIAANGYSSTEMAESFFSREILRVSFIMFWGKAALVEEFEQLNLAK
jgi:hypothetical protein